MTKQAGRPKGVSGGQAPALTMQQLKTLMKVAGADPINGLRNVAFLQILASGCRVSEPTHIRLCDVIDGKGGVVSSFVLGSSQNKSGRPRRVYLTEAAKKALAAYLEASSFDPNEKIFDLNPNYATQLVKRLMVDAGLPHASSHSLRRTFAHALDDMGTKTQFISAALGHSTISVTVQYLDCSTSNAEKAVSNLRF